jgi:predicted RNA-binding Zn-ribbon protein involved in translation (DUF1610 family)
VNYLLKNGAYPFLTPFGYEKDANNENKNKKDKDHTLRKKVWCDEVINCLYDTFECVKSFGKTAQKINDKYIVLKLGLTGAKARRILQNKIYIGYLNWGGEIFGCGENNEPRQELMAVSKEKFDRVQFIISQIKQKYNRDEDSIIDELIEEYGLAPVQAVCNLKAPCPKCGGIEIQNNGKEPKDWLQRKYICKDCGNEYRFPLSKHIKKIEKLVAQPCPKCGTTNQFALINDGSTLWQLRCKSCGFITFLHQYNDDHKVQKIQDVKKEKNGKKITSDSAQKSLVIFEDHVHDDMKDGMIVS